MRHKWVFWTLIHALLILFVCTTSFAGNPKAKPFLPDISETWTEIIPGQTEFMGRELNPTCSGAPGTDPTYKFYVKGGPVNNLVVFFDGGGACWDTMNCIYAQTYTTNLGENIGRLAQGKGLFDLDNPANPFKDWNFVFIPYCTGDIHWGSNDQIYSGYGEDTQEYTIHHRGFDNFLVILKWITENFKNPHKIFVTGSSAGSYGALMGFPYLQEAYPRSMASLLGDAGFGVLTKEFKETQIHNWGIMDNLPAWIPGFERDFSQYSMGEMYKMIAEYYPNRKFGQFTTAWDYIQAYFYNVMINIHNPYEWDKFFPVWIEWFEQMLEEAAIAAEAPNYRYYIAAGIEHTIMAYPEFYTEDSAGVAFLNWLRAMVENQGGTRGRGAMPWMNLECYDCDDPLPYP